jgi:hypothetical protein
MAREQERSRNTTLRLISSRLYRSSYLNQDQALLHVSREKKERFSSVGVTVVVF